MDTILHADANNQGGGNHISQVKLHIPQPHQARGPDHAQTEWQDGQQGVRDTSERQKGDNQDGEKRVPGRLNIASLHRSNRFVANNWRAGHIGVNRAQLPNELRQRLALPDIFLGIDL